MSVLELLAIRANVYYTPEEASQLRRVAPEAILGLLESGEVQGVRIDDQWRILRAALLGLSAGSDQSEASLVSQWLAASSRSLQEVWDNEEDAVYDRL